MCMHLCVFPYRHCTHVCIHGYTHVHMCVCMCWHSRIDLTMPHGSRINLRNLGAMHFLLQPVRCRSKDQVGAQIIPNLSKLPRKTHLKTVLQSEPVQSSKGFGGTGVLSKEATYRLEYLSLCKPQLPCTSARSRAGRQGGG